MVLFFRTVFFLDFAALARDAQNRVFLNAPPRKVVPPQQKSLEITTPTLSFRGDLVVRCHPSANGGKCGVRNVVKAIWSLGVTRPQRAAILGLRNVVKATWS